MSPRFQSLEIYMNIQSPQALMAAAAAKSAESQGMGATASEVKGKSYQFPSAPTNFTLPNGKRVLVPDGIHITEDAVEIAYLDAAVEVGNIWPADDADVRAILDKRTITPPAPIRTDAPN